MSLSRSLGSLVVRIAAGGLPEYKADLNAAATATQQATAKIEAATLSTKQISQALRGVPAQFTDIVTSLAAGQQPLTVFMQQGGQLKDMFGGTGAAARALGGYVAGLITPLSAGAAAFAATAVAAYQGAKEQESFTKASILSGNAAGISAQKYSDMVVSMSKLSGTKAAASEALTAFASTGQIGSENMQKFAQVAVQAQALIGQSVEDTAAQFVELGNEPVRASLKLNQSMNYLTAATFEQIKAAIELGDKQKAADIAQNAYAAATTERLAQVKANLGYLEQAWAFLGKTVKGTWDLMREAGRASSSVDQIAELKKQIEMRTAGNFGGSKASRDADNAADAVKIANLQKTLDFDSQIAKQDERRAKQDAAGIAGITAVTAANAAALTQQEKMNKALGDYRKSLGDIKSANPASALLDAKQIAKTEAAIREQYKEKPKVGAVAAFNDEANAKIEALKRGQALEETLAKQSVDRINSERRRGVVTEREAIDQVAAAEIKAMNSSIAAFEAEKAIAAAKKNSKKEVAALDGQIAAAKEKINGRELAQGYALLDLEFKTQAARKAFYNAADQASLTQLDALRDKNKAMREELEAIGLTATQLFNLSLARRDDAIAAQEQKIAAMKVFGDGESAAAIQLEIDKLGELQIARGLAIQTQDKKELSLELKGFDATAAQLESLANITGKMGEGFKRATTALGGFASAFKTLSNAEKNEKLTIEERTAAQVGGYAEMAGAAKGFFEENTAGYEIMQAAEQGFRAFELAMSIQSMVQKATEATTKVAANGTIAASGVIAAAGEIFAALGPFGFPAVAAMLAVMASLGFGGGGGSATFGTAGAGNQIGADGRKRAASPEEDMNAGTNYDPTTGAYTKQNKPQKTEQEMIDFANAAAIDAAANAVANLKIEAMKLTKGSEELEQSLARARLAASGMGIAQHELATQGMNEAELASYNYNQALRAQISVQMDIANGTELTSDNMKKLAGESRSLAIELMMASGDIAGARAMQREDDTANYTKEEVAVYDHNQAMRDQIEALNAGASAAREAAQAEEQLAADRAAIAGKLNVLLGRTTQLEFDRATALAATTDTASIAMLTLTYQLEDMYTAVDANYAKLERSVAKEKEIANTRLKSATDLSALLKTAKDAVSPAIDRATAQSQIAMYLALAKAGGVLPSAAALKPALDAIAKPSTDLFTTFEDYANDQARTASDIADLAGYADKQVSAEQQTIERLDLQLENAKQALDVLKGVDNSITTSAAADAAFYASLLALTAAKAGAASYNYAPPAASSSSGGGGGGGSYGGGSASAAAAQYDDIAGQDNAEIVAAYREYYNRNPDASGYENFVKSKLTGDALAQAILAASAGDVNGADYQKAVSNGYDPMNPLAKFYKTKKTTTGGSVVVDGSFAIGTNYLERDAIIQAHQGEEIKPRPFVDIDRRVRDETNALLRRLLETNQLQGKQLAIVSDELAEIKNASQKTTNTLDRVTRGGDAMVTTA